MAYVASCSVPRICVAHVMTVSKHSQCSILAGYIGLSCIVHDSHVKNLHHTTFYRHMYNSVHGTNTHKTPCSCKCG